ncbi:ABC transporter permease [Halorubrum trueperi]|uniref:ABC transporter permease n=1 Tax=Halorubrum trueperi TaxID=2004704 RepID=A0ABD5UL18_9EURY
MQQRHKYIFKRVGFTGLSLYIIATFLFLMFRILPGDPAYAVFQPGMSVEAQNSLREQFGLNQPLYIQYLKYIENLLQGNLGMSFSHREPVSSILVERTLNTLTLSLTAVVLAFVFGTLIGAYLSWKRGTKIDTIGIGAVLALRSAPAFWTGMLAIMIFSFNLELFPTGGMRSIDYAGTGLFARYLSVDFLWHLALPLMVTGLYYLSIPAFIMRNNMIDVLGDDYILMARAVGVSELSILYRHAARNALLPVFHYAGVMIGFAFGGSVVIETVFSWPGVGRMMWTAVTDSNYPLAQGAFLMIALVIMMMNLVVDILSVYVDPRASVGGGE